MNYCDPNSLNNMLEKYGLFAFQHRALERMLTFSYKIINFENSPAKLKEQLVHNESRKIVYDLRNKNEFLVPSLKTRSGENTFGYVYTKLANNFIIGRLVLKFCTFKLSIFNNINIIYIEAIRIFDKLNLNFKTFYF